MTQNEVENIHVRRRRTRYTKMILYMNCFWVQLSSSHVNIILASYYMFYPTGNFNSEAQLSINLPHKKYQSHLLLVWFSTVLFCAGREVKSICVSYKSKHLFSLIYYATQFITAFYYVVPFRTHNIHFILIKKHFKTFYHILKYSLHAQLHFLIHMNTTDIKHVRHHE